MFSELESCANNNQRKKVLAFLIYIADELEKLNNYHALMAFVASFSSLLVDKMELWKVGLLGYSELGLIHFVAHWKQDDCD